MNKKLINKKAFTLTELIIVIAIIGILAAVLIPSLSGYITRANKRAAEAEARGYLQHYEGYLIENSYTAEEASKVANASIAFELYCTENELDVIEATFVEKSDFVDTLDKNTIALTDTGFVYLSKDGKWVVEFKKGENPQFEVIKKDTYFSVSS